MLAFSDDCANLLAREGKITRQQVDDLMTHRAFPFGYVKQGEGVIPSSLNGRFAFVGSNPTARIWRVSDGATVGQPLPFSHTCPDHYRISFR
jgi:hypothetical protein